MASAIAKFRQTHWSGGQGSCRNLDLHKNMDNSSWLPVPFSRISIHYFFRDCPPWATRYHGRGHLEGQHHQWDGEKQTRSEEQKRAMGWACWTTCKLEEESPHTMTSVVFTGPGFSSWVPASTLSSNRKPWIIFDPPFRSRKTVKRRVRKGSTYTASDVESLCTCVDAREPMGLHSIWHGINFTRWIHISRVSHLWSIFVWSFNWGLTGSRRWPWIWGGDKTYVNTLPPGGNERTMLSSGNHFGYHHSCNVCRHIK